MFAEVFAVCRYVFKSLHCSNGILPGAREVVRAKKHIVPTIVLFKVKMAKKWLKIGLKLAKNWLKISKFEGDLYENIFRVLF